MNILHLCLSCIYADGYSYQENVLPIIHKDDGHMVKIIASTETYINNMNLGYVEAKKYLTETGIQIERIEYKRIFNQFFTHKIRNYSNLFDRIKEFNPDIIFIHGLSFYSIKDVIRYKKNNNEVKIYADTHADYYTSGTNWLSLNILHKVIYRSFIRKALPYIEKYFYITEETKNFSQKIYHVPINKMEYYPLGGLPCSDKDFYLKREITRKELGIKDNELVFIHAGKLDRNKKTIELLEAFNNTKNLNAKLLLVGAISKNIEKRVYEIIETDNRIKFMGWKNGKELEDLLCATDLYCQPGKVSATLQNAICCRCAIMSFPHIDYVKNLDKGNFIFVNNKSEIKKAFEDIKSLAINLELLRNKSFENASILDYRNLARRIY